MLMEKVESAKPEVIVESGPVAYAAEGLFVCCFLVFVVVVLYRYM